MGRRKLLTQKEINAILKSKNPHVYFFVFSFLSLIGTIVCFAIDYLIFLAGFGIFFTFLFLIIGFLVIPEKKESENIHEDICEIQPQTKNIILEKPMYDFFTENAIINQDYIQLLINAQRRIIKPTETAYEGLEEEKVLFVEYNEKTHSVKVTFENKKYYKTIEKYVQRDYQRYPIYSALKTKVKQYVKSYKLTNKNLENLHKEFSVSSEHLYMDIIVKLNNPAFVPYHFFLKALGSQLKIYIEYKRNIISNIEKQQESFEEQANQKIEQLNLLITQTQKTLKKVQIKADKLQLKINKKSSSKKEIKLAELNSTIDNLANIINNSQLEISNLSNEISISQNNAKVNVNDLKESIAFAQLKYHSLLKKFKPLHPDIKETEEFIPLNKLLGIEYEKIIGCYIIRNKKNKRCYVGQSKDVLRRLKQHFKGTVPNNQIFAEDYYTSSIDNKENLFEFKIIKLETKDELDKTEKELIEKYNAFVSGYNGTHGNA